MKNLVNISDFAVSRGVDRDTVTAYIRNHPEIQACTTRNGKNLAIDLDSTGYALLEKQYPLPQLIQVVQDEELKERVHELQERLLQSQQTIITLQSKLNENQFLLAEKEAVQLLLEDRTEQLQHERSQVEAYRQEVRELQEKLTAEKSKSWWDKLRGR